MLNKKLMILTIFFVSLLAVSAVSAANNVTDDIVSVEESDEVVSISDDVNNIVVSNENDDVLTVEDQESIGATDENELSASAGTFTDLANDIANAGGELNLTRDYTYSSGDFRYTQGITINKMIIINGNGFAIEGNNIAKAFQITSNNCFLKNISFINCLSSDYGGALDLKGDYVKISNCMFINCSSKDYSYSHGGAIHLSSDYANIYNCMFINCSSSSFYSSSGQYLSSYGGGIYLGGDYGNISNCTFINCSSNSFSSKGYAYGGAIYWEGKDGGMNECDFINCSTFALNESAISVVYWSGKNGRVNNSNFINCSSSSTSNSGIVICWQGDYGIVYNCSVVNCLSLGNIYGRGAVMWFGDYGNMYDCSFINCSDVSKYSEGSAVCWYGEYGNVHDCNFTNCSSSAVYTHGGAIHWEGYNGNLSFCNFINCFSNASKNSEAGVISWHGYNCTIFGCNFINCYSFARESSHGGAIYWSHDNCSISNCNFINCSVFGQYSGGGAVQASGSNCSLFNSIFMNCSVSASVYSYGGAVYIFDPDGFLSNCSFNNCYSNSSKYSSIFGGGGAIYWNGDNGTLMDSIFMNCSSNNVRGDVLWEGKNGLLINCSSDKQLLSSGSNCKIRHKSIIILNISEINFNEDILLKPIFNDDATGNFMIYVDNEYKETIPVGNTYLLSNLTAGFHNIKLLYSGDNYYAKNEIIKILKVNKINTSISIIPIQLISKNTCLNVILSNETSGQIIINILNKNYTENISNGKAIIYINDLPAGNYELTAYYLGDQNFNKNNISGNLSIKKGETYINILPFDNYVGKVVKINFTLADSATGILSVYINDNFVKNISAGNNIELENLPYGNYTVKVFYNGDDYYTPCENTTTFEVHKLNPTLRLSANNITSTNYVYFNTHIIAGNDVNLVFIFNEDATGKVNITHEFGLGHEANYTLDLVNGKVNISISNVMADSHYFTISYSGDDKYLPFYGESEVYFNYKPSSISYTIPDNLIWGDSFIINPVFPEDATGEIEITIYDNNGYYFNDFITAGSSYNFRILNGGTNYLRLDYSGDEYYDNSTYLREFNVDKLDTTCAITGNIEAGDYSTIMVTLNEDAKGTVDVFLNNKHYTGSLVNGSYMFTVPSLTAGIYNVTIKYNGDSKYNSFNKVETLKVTLKKTEVILNLKNIIVGRNLTFTPIISSGATGHINIYVDGSYKQTIPVGSSYTVAKPGIGNHIVKVSYISDGYFQSCINESSFWVFSEYPIVSQDKYVICNTGNYFKAQFLNEYGSPLSNGYVVFNVGGKDYARVTDNNGWATLDLDLDIGIYIVTSINLVYNENKVNKLTVFSSVESQDLTRAYNSGIDFNATFLNNNAKALANTYVLFKVNSEDYTVKTNMNGQAILNVPLTVGTYNIVSINTLTGENKTNTLTIVPSVQASDMVRAYNSTMDYKATFFDVDGTYLANHAVNFKIGEATYESTTDNKGVAILNVPLNVGKYNVTAINPITGEKSTKKLTILPRIIENNDMIMDTDCDDYFKVRIVGDDGNVAGSGQTVTFKFNNAIYNIKTDSQGYASLLISQFAKGKYPITVTYKGFTVSNKIFVYEDLESIITIDVNDADYNQNLILNVSVIPEYMYGNLTVEIIGSNGYHVQYEASANAVFSKDLTGLNASDYVVAVRFTDNEHYYMSQDTAVFEISKINPNVIVVVYDSEYSQNATITVNIPQASGNVTIRVGDKRTYTEYLPEDGVIVKKINDLDIGEYDISVTYNGNDNFNKVTKTAKLNITKIQTYVWLDSLDEFDYGQVIVVNLTASVDGVVKVEFDEDVQFVNVVANRLYQLKYYGYEAGWFYPVSAALTPADSNYDVSSYEISVGVASINTAMEVISDYIELGQPTNIVVIVNSSATGNVRLIWNNQEYVQNLTEGRTVFNIYGLGIGRYSLEVFYDGDNNFYAIDGLANFNVTKIKSYSIDIPSKVNNLDNNLTIGLPVNATGNVTVTINNVNYNAFVANAKAVVNLSTLPDADYQYFFVYSGDDRYSSFTTTGTLTIKKPIVPEVVIPPLDNPSADGSVTVTLPSDATGTVTLTINGNDYPFVVKNGVANVVIPYLDGGNYPYTITYSGDGKYASYVDMGIVTIAQKMPTVLANNMTVTYGSGYDFIATFFKADGSPLANSYVMFAVNGNDNVVKTDANGIAILNIGLGNGVYDIVSTNLATGESANNVLTIVGQPTPTVISASSVTTVYNGGKYLVVTLKDSNGKALSGAKVTVVLDGKTYTLSTDANGQIKVFTNDLAPNAYVATITFGGDGKYVGSSTTAKITVVKATLKLTAAKKTYKAKIKTKKYTVTLKDNNGKVIRGMVITLKVKGKTFKAKTNAKGKATFKIKKLTKKGTFKATVKYVGNAYYKAVTKTVKIKIK